MQTGSLIDIICNICMALGGLGTLGTLIYMIADSRKKTQQIETVQKIQSLQLESLYEPDLRLVSWSYNTVGNVYNELVLSNHGDNLRILSIQDSPDFSLLNNDGMQGWFPYNLDKETEIHIPLSSHTMSFKGVHSIWIECSNRLGLNYLVSIRFDDGKPTIQKPVIQR